MLWAFAWPSAGPTHIELAKRLAKAHLVGNALPQLSAIRPDATLADAYDVQKRFVDKVAKTHKGIAGYKGAVAGEAGQKALKLNGPLSPCSFVMAGLRRLSSRPWLGQVSRYKDRDRGGLRHRQGHNPADQ